MRFPLHAAFMRLLRALKYSGAGEILHACHSPSEEISLTLLSANEPANPKLCNLFLHQAVTAALHEGIMRFDRRKP